MIKIFFKIKIFTKKNKNKNFLISQRRYLTYNTHSISKWRPLPPGIHSHTTTIHTSIAII